MYRRPLAISRIRGDERGDAQLRRREFDRVDARGYIALRARMCDAAQRAENDDVAARNQFRAGVDVADDDDVADVRERLPAAQGTDVVQGSGCGWFDVQIDGRLRLRDDCAT